MNRTLFSWKLFKILLLFAGLYLLLPECLSQRVILINTSSHPLEHLALSLSDSQGSALLLWQGELPKGRTVFLGFDAPYAPFHHILTGQRDGAALRHEFGYFYGQSREIVLIADGGISSHHWNDDLPACITGRGFDCLLDRLVSPFRNHVCRPW